MEVYNNDICDLLANDRCREASGAAGADSPGREGDLWADLRVSSPGAELWEQLHLQGAPRRTSHVIRIGALPERWSIVFHCLVCGSRFSICFRSELLKSQ